MGVYIYTLRATFISAEHEGQTIKIHNYDFAYKYGCLGKAGIARYEAKAAYVGHHYNPTYAFIGGMDSTKSFIKKGIPQHPIGVYDLRYDVLDVTARKPIWTDCNEFPGKLIGQLVWNAKERRFAVVPIVKKVPDRFDCLEVAR